MNATTAPRTWSLSPGRALALPGAFVLALALVRARVEHRDAEDVAGKKIRRELQPLKASANCLRQTCHGGGLGQTRDSLNQQMAVGQQTDEHLVD